MSGPTHSDPHDHEPGHQDDHRDDRGHDQDAHHEHRGHSHAGHAHGGHAHHPSPDGHGRLFLAAIVLNSGFVAIEAAAGWRADSMALLSDAGHNLGDVLALALAWGGAWAARQPTSPRFTWGWRRAALLAALINAALLLAAAGAIAFESVARLATPVAIDATLVTVVAGTGIVINGLTAWLFMRGQRDDINLRGAFLHMLGDAAISAAVVIGALGVAATGWLRIDPALSLAVSLFIGWSAYGLLRDALSAALDGVPSSIDPGAVRQHLLAMPGVTGLHDLHIWPAGTSGASLSAHLTIPQGHPGDAFLVSANASLKHRFGIEHTTLQIETGGTSEVCRQDCSSDH
jgi:cobalt-zinc-cadmium efflux system protein